MSAVNGTTAGLGWMLALLADLVVAAQGARWTHVFARRGMVPHAGDPFFLPRVLPLHRLNEVAMLSDTIDVGDPCRVGSGEPVGAGRARSSPPRPSWRSASRPARPAASA